MVRSNQYKGFSDFVYSQKATEPEKRVYAGPLGEFIHFLYKYGLDNDLESNDEIEVMTGDTGIIFVIARMSLFATIGEDETKLFQNQLDIVSSMNVDSEDGSTIWEFTIDAKYNYTLS